MIVTPEHIQQYNDQGYFVLERVISPDQLEALRSEAQHFIDLMHAEMDRQGVNTIGISHRNSRYFVNLRHNHSEILTDFLFSDLMAGITREILGEEVYLFYEQYVVKAAEVGMKFSCHQDSGYVDSAHKPYLTCWCALDDMTEENGTVYILPYEQAGTRDKIEHIREEGTNDRVGYFGDKPGIPLLIPAGSIACFSSTALHRSGTNQTDRMRRVYLAQYSAEPIYLADGKTLKGLATPFIHNGERVQGQASLIG